MVVRPLFYGPRGGGPSADRRAGHGTLTKPLAHPRRVIADEVVEISGVGP